MTATVTSLGERSLHAEITCLMNELGETLEDCDCVDHEIMRSLLTVAFQARYDTPDAVLTLLRAFLRPDLELHQLGRDT